MVAVVHDQEPLAREPPLQLGHQEIEVGLGHRDAAQVLVHLRVGSGRAAGHVDLRHEGVVVGPVRRHGLDVGEQRLARRLEVSLHLGKGIAVVEAVALLGGLGALRLHVENLFEPDRGVEPVVGHEVAHHRVEHDVAIAAARERLRQGVLQLVLREGLHELAHAAEGVRRHAGQQREFGEPGGAPIGLDPQLMQLIVVGAKERVDGMVVAQRREQRRLHHQFLMDHDDVRRLGADVAGGRNGEGAAPRRPPAAPPPAEPRATTPRASRPRTHRTTRHRGSRSRTACGGARPWHWRHTRPGRRRAAWPGPPSGAGCASRRRGRRARPRKVAASSAPASASR